MSSPSVLASESALSTTRPVAARRIRAGAVALVLAGLSYLSVSVLLAGVPTAPDQNVAFALGANTTAWRIGTALGTFSLAFVVLGSFALYAHLARTSGERWAFVGLLLTTGLIPLFLPGVGYAQYVVPAVGSLIQAGHTDAVAVLDEIFKEPFWIVIFLSGILYNVGYMFTGVAIWRSGTLIKWCVILMGLLGIPAFLDVPLFQRIAPVIGGGALIATGVSLWTQSSMVLPSRMAGY